MFFPLFYKEKLLRIRKRKPLTFPDKYMVLEKLGTPYLNSLVFVKVLTIDGIRWDLLLGLAHFFAIQFIAAFFV